MPDPFPAYSECFLHRRGIGSPYLSHRPSIDIASRRGWPLHFQLLGFAIRGQITKDPHQPLVTSSQSSRWWKVRCALIHAYDVHDGSSTFDGRRFGASRTSLKRCDMNGFDGSREPTECSRCTDAMRQGLAEAFQVTVTPSFSRRCQSRLTGQKQKEVESARRDEGGMVSGCTEGHGMRENSPAVSLISMESSTLFG